MMQIVLPLDLALYAAPPDSTPTAPNTHLALPLISLAPNKLVIAAAYIDSTVAQEPDSAILIWNLGLRPQSMAGWRLESAGRIAQFPLTSTVTIDAGSRLWCAAEATAFALTFGELAGCEWKTDTSPAPNLRGSLQLVNHGGTILLRAATGAPVDVLVYGDESRPTPGWDGRPAQLYTRGAAAAPGQVWRRKLQPASGLPIDSDGAADWAGDLADIAWGRRIQMPGWLGWDAGTLLWPRGATSDSTLRVWVGPEGLYEPLRSVLQSAQHTIELSIYTFEHPQLATLLAEAASRGVRIRLLLEGNPPGGITNLQKWCVATMANSGVEVLYYALAADAPAGQRKRYRFEHAKYGIVDGSIALIGSENFTRDAMPASVGPPVGGRRGFYLATDAPDVISTLQQIFGADWAPGKFSDRRAYAPTDPRYGAPPIGYTPPQPAKYPVTEAEFTQPVEVHGPVTSIVMSAPENALRPDVAILGLLERAGSGDEISLMQLYEQKYWGDVTSNPTADPNPRLQALIGAARRGAQVRVLLDGYFDDDASPRSNSATVNYLNAIAAAEHLNLAARLGNPTAGGIHAKLVLVRLGEERWSAVGSLNGSEVSYKLNREVVLLVDRLEIYVRLHEVFLHDWRLSTSD
ncbi:MAG: hypothetical protein IPK16_24690 [Anaerolineales bacterium]|nr:hypothetical protein [Anaerolineales bacterium]